jgi:hypothetical protein
MPVLFEENRGQTDPRVAFLVKGRGVTAYFTAGGVTWAVRGPAGRWVLRSDFVDARAVPPKPRDHADTVISYFRGKRSEWRVGCRTCREIAYEELWPGIDLVVRADGPALKSTFVVRPGANPARIRMRWLGTARLSVTGDGDLRADTGYSPLLDAAPMAWQEDGRPVPAAWTVADDTAAFRLGAHDPARTLFLDPAVLVYAGTIGGEGWDDGRGIAVDGSRNAYVVGSASSSETTFPVTVGPDLTCDQSDDAFIARIRTDGTGFVYAGYIGGTGTERATGVAVGGDGSAYVTGYAAEGSGFPVLVGPGLTHSGGYDAFVAKVAPAGTGLTYCGYIGGDSPEDYGLGIAVDSGGSAYVVGETSSAEASFPVTGGPDTSYNGGTSDAFVAKVMANGAGLVYAGYLGGSGRDRASGVAVDGDGNAYVTGSAGTGFPTTVGPDLTFNGASGDAFVAKVNSAGSGLVYSGYIGGPLEDWGNAISVRDGYAYVAGGTWSGEAHFPVTVGPDLTINFSYDGFVAKVAQDGTGFAWCGYLGGSQPDVIQGIAVDPAGRACVAGATLSAETQNFPVAGGPDLTWNGGTNDAFVARVKADGTGLDYAGYIGASGADEAQGIAVDSSGDVYVVGYTDSPTPGFPVVGPDLLGNGQRDAFVAKVGIGDYGLVLAKGKIANSTKALKDSIRVSGTVSVPGGFPLVLKPLEDGVTVEAGDAADPFVLAIPAGDPGWKSARGKHAWKGAAGSLKIDTARRTVSFAAKRFDFATTPTNPIHVLLRLGIVPLLSDGDWTANPKAPGSFSYP